MNIDWSEGRLRNRRRTWTINISRMTNVYHQFLDLKVQDSQPQVSKNRLYEFDSQGIKPMQEKQLLYHATYEGLCDNDRRNPVIQSGSGIYQHVRSMSRETSLGAYWSSRHTSRF